MKEVTQIDCPKEWNITNDWDSHKPLLWLSLSKVDKKWVYEYGIGEGSTLLIRDYIKDIPKSILHSFETNKEWFDKITKGYTLIETSGFYIENKIKYNHSVYLVDKYDCPPAYGCLCFIDCAPAEIRKDLIDSFKNKAEVIVIHDTEEGADYVYSMKKILNTFKYRLDFKPVNLPATTCVSNFLNVEEWI